MWACRCCHAKPCAVHCWPRCGRHARRGALGREAQTAVARSNMTPIAERPAGVATCTVPGHGEGDLIKGARDGSAVGTLVERTTRLVILAKMTGTDATSARQCFTTKLRHVPALLRKTLTYDRGKEMAEHEQLAQQLAIQIFFADPYRPGNAAPTRIRMACCASTCRRARSCRATRSAS